MFNSFLNIYLRIFYSSFPWKKVISRNNKDNKNWITIGIKISCRHKKELYLTCRNSNNLELKRHYQVYCKILANVIEEAKRKYYDKKIQKSSNKCKAIWDIIKELTNNQNSQPDIQELIIGSKRLKDQDVTDAFNNYFLSVIDKISKKCKKTR